MDVPVPVLRNVGCDGTTEAVPRKPVVLVIEDVGPISPQPFGKLAVPCPWLHQAKRLPVIVSDRAGDMIPDDPMPVHTLAGLALKLRQRLSGLHFAAASCVAQARQIANCIP